MNPDEAMFREFMRRKQMGGEQNYLSDSGNAEESAADQIERALNAMHDSQFELDPNQLGWNPEGYGSW